MIEIRKAERKASKLRLGIAAPAGAGKTYGALQLAFGLGGKVGMIDTENGSGDLYSHLGDYYIIQLSAPYTIKKYLEAINAFESAGCNVIIIDSLTHAWAGEGGLLDKQAKIAEAMTRQNSYTAWREITPEHNALVEKMLTSKSHIIATMRSKQDYVQEKNEKTGKTEIKKVGMAPIQRDGMDYEFTIMIDINQKHDARATKDRTSLLDGEYFKLNKDIGEKLKKWLESGKQEEDETESIRDFINSCETLEDLQNLYVEYKDKFGGNVKIMKEINRMTSNRKKAITSDTN